MNVEKRFGRFLPAILVFLVGVSMAVVIGLLYVGLTESMTREFFRQVEARRADVRLRISDSISRLHSRVLGISQNNNIRVAMLLGFYSKVRDIMGELHPPADGFATFICLGNDTVIPRPSGHDQYLNAYLKELCDRPTGMRTAFLHPKHRLPVAAVSTAIVDKRQHIGTVIGVYDVTKDPYLRHLLELVGGRFQVVNNGAMSDPSTGRTVPFPGDFTPVRNEQGDVQWISPTSSRHVGKVAELPELFLSISGKPLKARKQALTRQIFGIAAGVFLLTLAVSVLILRKVTDPLRAMADEAQAIADAPTTGTLSADRLQYREFRQLARAFNAVLARIRKQADALEIRNTLLKKEIEERERAESELRIGEERYRLLFENAQEAIFIVQEDMVKFPNPMTLRMTGYDAGYLASVPFSRMVHPHDREMVLQRDRLRTAGQSPPSIYSFRIIDQMEKERWVQVNAVRVIWEDQPATLNFLRDITEHKRLERQLQQSHKMQAIGTLAGGIAHDFNNILSSVIGYSELARDDAPKDSVLYDNIQEVLIAGKRARSLVRQILTFSRKSDQELKPLQVNLVIKEALQLLRATLPATIEIQQMLDCQAFILGDPTQIHQIVMNMASNAAQAMEEQGGILDLRLAEIEPAPAFFSQWPDLKPGRFLRFSVSDTGHGIAPEHLDAIFEPYFTTKDMGKGTGLGLSVVHGIVKQYGGEITVHSIPGRGTRFDIYLPVVDVQASFVPERSGRIPTGDERILFVDDEKKITKMVARQLGGLGYQVTTFNSATEALSLFYEDPSAFDMVITDMTMPLMTGDELSRSVLEKRPDIPILLCTGYTRSITESEALELGIRQLMIKPFGIRDLAEAVRRHLDETNGEKDPAAAMEPMDVATGDDAPEA